MNEELYSNAFELRGKFYLHFTIFVCLPVTIYLKSINIAYPNLLIKSHTIEFSSGGKAFHRLYEMHEIVTYGLDRLPASAEQRLNKKLMEM